MLEDAGEAATATALPSQSGPSDAKWVKGRSVLDLAMAQCIVGVDPGCEAMFTVVAVHSPQALQFSNLHIPPGTSLIPCVNIPALDQVPIAEVASTAAYEEHITNCSTCQW